MRWYTGRAAQIKPRESGNVNTNARAEFENTLIPKYGRFISGKAVIKPMINGSNNPVTMKLMDVRIARFWVDLYTSVCMKSLTESAYSNC